MQNVKPNQALSSTGSTGGAVGGEGEGLFKNETKWKTINGASANN